MNEGDTLIIKSGYYSFEDGLSLDVNNVTVTGEGMEETVLDFKNQQSGAQGFLVTSDMVTLQDFSILDAKGDALKVIGAKGINMINLKTETDADDTPATAECEPVIGEEHTLVISVEGGGTTYETLTYNSITEGDSIV